MIPLRPPAFPTSVRSIVFIAEDRHMRQPFCNTRRIAPSVVLTFMMTLLAVAPTWAQNLVVHEVRQEAGTGELLMGGGPFAAGLRVFTVKGELNVKTITPSEVRLSPP